MSWNFVQPKSVARPPPDRPNPSTHTYRLPIFKEQAAPQLPDPWGPAIRETAAKRRDYRTLSGLLQVPCRISLTESRPKVGGATIRNLPGGAAGTSPARAPDPRRRWTAGPRRPGRLDPAVRLGGGYHAGTRGYTTTTTWARSPRQQSLIPLSDGIRPLRPRHDDQGHQRPLQAPGTAP